jgi:ABC-type glutathione transport system ATPase component
MRQRAMIAMSIANEPDVLIADEPTTALDATIQAQVLEVIERIKVRTRSSVILITHDLGVVAGVADRVMVMYAVGRRAGRLRDIECPGTPLYGGPVGITATARSAHGRPASDAHQGAAALLDLSSTGLRLYTALSIRQTGSLRSWPARTAVRRLRSHVGVLPGGRTRTFEASRVSAMDTQTREIVAGGPVLEVTDLVKDFPIRAGLFVVR